MKEVNLAELKITIKKIHDTKKKKQLIRDSESICLSRNSLFYIMHEIK